MKFQQNLNDLSNQYEDIVEQEDQYIVKLQTCGELMTDTLAIISMKAGMLHLDTVKKVTRCIHAIEQELYNELFHIRLEKSLLSNKMRQMK
ncbi:hypothetical protein [Paenibacillus glacialis]|uniref:Uncharacterized protein n=1 Tax=Paenibacillus glacialis TaxID=494026 RepID=A0A168F9V7_9BACL|nr:hypothetical protein [Paenibacillus glacialis]OAB35995.1 hypothetical protein PGLA_21455 [Paenibacillus glacialis]